MDYPESVAESSEDGRPQLNSAEIRDDPTSLPPLDVGLSLVDIQSVPSLTSPSNSTASSSSLKEVPEVFVDLIDILDQARWMGVECLNAETVEQMVLHRNPNLLVGVGRPEGLGTPLTVL